MNKTITSIVNVMRGVWRRFFEAESLVPGLRTEYRYATASSRARGDFRRIRHGTRPGRHFGSF